MCDWNNNTNDKSKNILRDLIFDKIHVHTSGEYERFAYNRRLLERYQNNSEFMEMIFAKDKEDKIIEYMKSIRQKNIRLCNQYFEPIFKCKTETECEATAYNMNEFFKDNCMPLYVRCVDYTSIKIKSIKQRK